MSPNNNLSFGKQLQIIKKSLIIDLEGCNAKQEKDIAIIIDCLSEIFSYLTFDLALLSTTYNRMPMIIKAIAIHSISVFKLSPTIFSLNCFA